jgi:hypothetical protein
MDLVCESSHVLQGKPQDCRGHDRVGSKVDGRHFVPRRIVSLQVRDEAGEALRQ